MPARNRGVQRRPHNEFDAFRIGQKLRNTCNKHPTSNSTFVMKEHKNDSTDTLARFGRDKRVRTATVSTERVERSPRPRRDAADSERPSSDRQPRKRASYNPNFSADNRPLNEERRSRGYGEKPRYTDGEASGKRFQGKGPAAHGRYGQHDEQTARTPRQQYKRYDNNRAEGGAASAYGERKGARKYGEKPAYGQRREERYGKYSAERRGGERSSYPRYDASKSTGEIRLNRFIAQSGLCSRREADDYIQAGLVSVNGKIVTELGTKVLPTDEVRFNDERVQGEKKVYLVLNKPKGYVTTMEDPHTDKTVMELVKGACTERVYPVGRLDKNSVGLLLFTNDGDLTRQLTHPSYRKKKIYQVTLDKPLTRADMDAIAEGVTLEDGEIYADEISYVSENKEEVGIEIHSGRNRIVRRIFEHLGYTVLKLDRVYYAGLTKKNLKRGQWRFLTREEVERLKSGQYE